MKMISSPFGRIIKFLKESKAELAKVTWPSKNEVIRDTVLVILSVLVAIAIVGSFDILLIKLVQLFVVR